MNSTLHGFVKNSNNSNIKEIITITEAAVALLTVKDNVLDIDIKINGGKHE